MLKSGFLIIALLLTGLVSGCATPETPEQLAISNIATRDGVISLPVTETVLGLYMVYASVQTGEGTTENVPFIIDTGATKTAIYKNSLARFKLSDTDAATIQIYGMVDSGRRPRIDLPLLTLGHVSYANLDVAVLDNRIADEAETAEPPVGILGLDVLTDYRLHYDADTALLSLIPSALPPPIIPPSWRLVTLMENPYSPEKRTLKFMELRLAGTLTPALVDTGSEFTIINWSVARYPQLRALRRRLKEYWKIQGSIGQFNPMTKVRLMRFRGGQKFWEEKDVIVMEFDSLDVLGVNDQPFVIAGMNLFKDTSFYIDFQTNELRFAPDPPSAPERGRSNSVISYRTDGTVIRDE